MDVPSASPQLTFIGREDELDFLTLSLRDPTARLITLVGPGGIGKTRLAQQAAALCADSFSHGVTFVPLASLLSPDYLVPALADALHFSFYAREDLPGQLLGYLREKQLLLVLDSFEQVIASAAWLEQVMHEAPGVKLLVTSREQLGLEGEQAIVLQGMRFPATHDAAGFDDSPAVRLFLHNARLLNPFYEVTPAERPHVLRICQMVGGLPLALQMAAAWTRAISCEQIAREIERDMDFLRAPFRSAPERHQSLKVIFEYSWRMLPFAERVVCRQLSVFRGFFSSDAAQQVSGATDEQLRTFVQKSLLQQAGPDTYRLHATLRQYAAARLAQDADEEHQTRQRHAGYFHEFLRVRQPGLKGALQSQALGEIAEVLDDVRTAWQFSIQQRDLDALDACAEGLQLFLSIRSHTREGLETFGQVVALCESLQTCPPDVCMRWCSYQAVFALELSDYSLARQLLQRFPLAEMSVENRAFTYNLLARLAVLANDYTQAIENGRKSLEIYERLQDAWGRARVLDTLGVVSWTLGDYDSAGRYFEQALGLYRHLDVQQGTASELDHLGVVARERGKLALARPYFEESLAIFRLLDARLNLAYVANHLGGIIAEMGDLPGAEPYFEECIAIGREIGELRVVAYTLSDWATFLGRDAQHRVRVRALCDEALAIFERLNDLFGVVAVWLAQGAAALSAGDLPLACRAHQQALQVALKVHNPRLVDEALFGFARFFYEKQDYPTATSLLGFLSAGNGDLPAEKQALLVALQSQFAPEEFSRLLALGRAQSLETYVSQLAALP
ncbi:MAG: ATP-binding protein [Chloroflexota bacterium]